MKTKIKFPDDKSLSSKSTIYYFLSIILFLSFNYSIAQTYLTDGQQVPVFDPAPITINKIGISLIMSYTYSNIQPGI
jgi:hypothetical protein